MDILFLRDRKSESNGLAEALEAMLARAGHAVAAETLSREALAPCSGCFGCWSKTPGQCVVTRDAANALSCRMMRADAVVLLSEIVFGGFSADIKAFLDRAIQNVLPFFEIHEGEMHHPMRYERFPIWIAVGYGRVSGAQRDTFALLARRNALNMRPERQIALCVNAEQELMQQEMALLNVLEASA